jgi:hypothetical protein
VGDLAGAVVADRARQLQALRTIQRALDERFSIPGTRLRFGWDPIIGLVPWAGDAVTAFVAGAIIVQAHKLGVPRIVQLRMLMNVGLDLLLGVVPFAGDVADFFWKANTKNMALLERHAAGPLRPSAGDWLFVGGILAAVALLALLPLVLLVFVLRDLVKLGI